LEEYYRKAFIISNDNYNLQEIEKAVIEKTLEKTSWNKSLAAKLLNIDRKALYNRIEKYNITQSFPKGA
jgi:two-component system response regulator HydG